MANGKISKVGTAESAPIIGLAIGILLTIWFYQLGTHPNTHEFAKISQVPVVLEEKMSIDASPKETLVTEPLTASPVKDIDVPQVVTPISVEQTVWDRLISEGFTREQAAGIAGNLQQEHNFKTEDVPGGLGIVQWTGNRRANLLARANSADLNVQLDFMMEELRGTESRALAKIQAATTVEAATIAFQNAYERCGKCHQAKRIQYAYVWYGRF